MSLQYLAPAPGWEVAGKTQKGGHDLTWAVMVTHCASGRTTSPWFFSTSRGPSRRYVALDC